MICKLDKDINKCPYYSNGKCSYDKKCSFQITKDAAQYVRKERWYEKYYKK